MFTEMVSGTLEGRPFDEWTAAGKVFARFFRTADGYIARFIDIADFEIHETGRIRTIWTAPTADSEAVDSVLRRKVAPLAQSIGGMLVLHGSAVRYEGRTLAFVGWSGQGKSTLAAAFCNFGAAFYTDDALMLQQHGQDGFLVFPSQALIRLRDDSRKALVGRGASVQQPAHSPDKVHVLASQAHVHCVDPTPLDHVFFLDGDESGAVQVRRLGTSEAFHRLIGHSILLDAGEPKLRARHLSQVGRLAQQPIHYRLDYPRRYEALADLCQALLTDLGDESSAKQCIKMAGNGMLSYPTS